MIRALDDLVLLKEVDRFGGVEYNSSVLRHKYPSKIVIIRHRSFIYKDILSPELVEKLTDLSDYFQLGDLADHLCIGKETLLKQVYMMKSLGEQFLFPFLQLEGIYFIRVTAEFKRLLHEYQPFLAKPSDKNSMKSCRLLGRLMIGFY